MHMQDSTGFPRSWCLHADCLREMVEPFLYNAGVDIVFHGTTWPLLSIS